MELAVLWKPDHFMPTNESALAKTNYFAAILDQEIAKGLNLQLAGTSSSVKRDVELFSIGGLNLRTDVDHTTTSMLTPTKCSLRNWPTVSNGEDCRSRCN